MKDIYLIGGLGDFGSAYFDGFLENLRVRAREGLATWFFSGWPFFSLD